MGLIVYAAPEFALSCRHISTRYIVNSGGGGFRRAGVGQDLDEDVKCGKPLRCLHEAEDLACKARVKLAGCSLPLICRHQCLVRCCSDPKQRCRGASDPEGAEGERSPVDSVDYIGRDLVGEQWRERPSVRVLHSRSAPHNNYYAIHSNSYTVLLCLLK
jgi:hypothetical protein